MTAKGSETVIFFADARRQVVDLPRISMAEPLGGIEIAEAIRAGRRIVAHPRGGSRLQRAVS